MKALGRPLTWLPLAGIVLIGAAVRLWNLGDASLWLDEAASVQFAGLPWSTLWLSGYDNAPPVYYSLVKIVLLFSDSEFAIRLPSVVFGVLTIPVIYLAGRLIGGPWAASAAALYLALSAVQVEYSQEARGYSLLVFALAIALLGLLLLFEQQVRGRADRRAITGMALYAIGILVALYTNNIAVFFVFVTQLVFAYHWVTTGGRDRGLAIRWLLMNGVVFLLWLPWAYIILTELLGNGTMAHLSHITAGQAFGQWRAVQGFTFVWRAQPWLDLMLAVVFVLGVLSLRRRPAAMLILLFVAVLGPVLVWLLGYVHPLFMERTIVWAFLGAALLVGAGIGAMKRWLALPLMLLLGVISARSVMSFNELGEAETEDWRSGYAAWRQQVVPPVPGQAALFCSPTVVIPMVYYARQEPALPLLLAWGSVPGGAGAALMLDQVTVDSDARPTAWLDAIPHDLFLWKRGAVDEGRRYLPPLPDEGRWQAAVWHRLEVIVSHCPEDSRAALNTALTDAGWQVRISSDFKGGEFASYVCQRAGCRLPGP